MGWQSACMLIDQGSIPIEVFFSTGGRFLSFSFFLFCSDFGNESNGIFVLGWVFFSSDKLRHFNKPFLTEFFYIIRKLLLS